MIKYPQNVPAKNIDDCYQTNGENIYTRVVWAVINQHFNGQVTKFKLMRALRLPNAVLCYPTGPSTVLDIRNPWIDQHYVVQERRTTDFKAPKF